VKGDVESTDSSVTLGVDSYVMGATKASSSATLGAGAYTCGNVDAATATLGADSFVRGNMNAETSTVAAGGFVTGVMSGVTTTLGANACYGVMSVNMSTITQGAGAGECGSAGVNTDTSRADSTDLSVNLCLASAP
jgi:hypothetical protein